MNYEEVKTTRTKLEKEFNILLQQSNGLRNEIKYLRLLKNSIDTLTMLEQFIAKLANKK